MALYFFHDTEEFGYIFNDIGMITFWSKFCQLVLFTNFVKTKNAQALDRGNLELHGQRWLSSLSEINAYQTFKNY